MIGSIFMKIVKDDFNSQIFKMEMGNVFIDNEIKSFEQFVAEEQEKKEHFNHLNLKVDTNNKLLLNFALASGYYLVDTLVEYLFVKNKSILPKLEHKCCLRDFKKNDLKEIKTIAKNSFKIDRFHSDTNLKYEDCDLYYEKWIENSCNGFAEKVIVATYNNDIVGFTTGKTNKDEEYGHLVLSAVSDKYRGLGVYTSMIHQGIEWILNEHPEKTGILVGTQLNNIAVQKAWIKLGLTIFRSTYVLHKYLGKDC